MKVREKSLNLNLLNFEILHLFTFLKQALVCMSAVLGNSIWLSLCCYHMKYCWQFVLKLDWFVCFWFVQSLILPLFDIIRLTRRQKDMKELSDRARRVLSEVCRPRKVCRLLLPVFLVVYLLWVIHSHSELIWSFVDHFCWCWWCFLLFWLSWRPANHLLLTVVMEASLVLTFHVIVKCIGSCRLK